MIGSSYEAQRQCCFTNRAAIAGAHLHEETATPVRVVRIMTGSDPEAELQETRLNFRPMLNALAVPAYGPSEVGKPLDGEARTRGI